MNKNKKIGFTMPHIESPLSAGVPGEMKGITPAEYLSNRAIEKEKELYLQKPDGEDEFNKEITLKYVTDYPEYKIRNLPTDDGEIIDEEFKSTLKPYQLGSNYKTDETPVNRNHGTHKVGDKLSDKDVYNYEAKFHGLASAGRSLTAEDVSDIQEDEHGQYVTWQNEVRRGKDRGKKVIDTIRPVKKIGIFSDKIPAGYHTFKKN